MQLQFVKSTLTVNPCMVSKRSTKQFFFSFQMECCSFVVEHSLTLSRNYCCSQVKQTSEDPGSFLSYMYKCECNLASFVFPLFATILRHACFQFEFWYFDLTTNWARQAGLMKSPTQPVFGLLCNAFSPVECCVTSK